jgi:hypothetical protein
LKAYGVGKKVTTNWGCLDDDSVLTTRDSRLHVPQFCKLNSFFGKPRLFFGDKEYELFKKVQPRDERGFEVPYEGLIVSGLAYTNIVGSLVR